MGTSLPNEKEKQKQKWSNRIRAAFQFIKSKQIGVMLSLMMLFLCFVMFSWGVAFWANGLYETHFDLGSCWQGITVVATGLVTVASFAAMPYVEKWIDSKYNSEVGTPPESESTRADTEKSN